MTRIRTWGGLEVAVDEAPIEAIVALMEAQGWRETECVEFGTATRVWMDREDEGVVLQEGES
jgi:hypothetical protein